MSVINRVLRDLDQAGEPAPTGPEVHPARLTGWPPHTRNVLLACAALLGLALAVWLLMPTSSGKPGKTPVASPVVQTPPPPAGRPLLPASRHAAPAAPLPAPMPEEAPAPVEPTAAPEKPPALRIEARVVKEVAPPVPKDPVEEAWRQVAQSLEQGRVREAREHLGSLLRLAPGHAVARQTQISLLIEGGERVEAMRLLDAGRALHPADPWYPRSLAQLHLQSGNPAQAAAVLGPGLGKTSEAGDWALYAGALVKLARHAEAAQAWREALRGNPDQGVWWVGLGVALEQVGQRPDAAQAYQRAQQTRLSAELREFAAGKAAELQ